MEAYRTEDEQVEALKKWWKENGTSTILAIVAVLGGYFGWQAWDTRQTAEAEAASNSYQQLLQLMVEIEQNPSPTESQYATANHLSDTLKTEFSDSEYARYAALLQARLLVSQDNLEGAETELLWALEGEVEPAMAQVINLRLARVLAARGKVEEALALLNGEQGAYAVAYQELRGDILQAEGDIEAAREAYGQALQAAQTSMTNATLVQMKLEALPQPEAAPAEAQAQE